MVSFLPVLSILGIIISLVGGAMMIPLLVDMWFGDGLWFYFFLSSCGTIFIGGLLAISFKPVQKVTMTTREIFFITTFSWVVACFFAAIPFWMGIKGLSFTDGLFESVSALTTTGSTILQKLNTQPKGILIWRALLQWFGGVGIIIMAISIFPALKIGGMQLFRSEFSDKSDKLLPNSSQIAKIIITIYGFFSFLCCILLLIFGMGFFDAICHTMSTISTGGMSNYDDSIGYFESRAIEWVLLFFMIIGGSTFILYYKASQGHWTSLAQDSQMRLYIKMILLSAGLLVLWRYATYGGQIAKLIQESLFDVVSTISSTGFSVGERTYKGSVPAILFLILAIIGGCTGSTAGGIKVFRLQILMAVAKSQIRQLRYPHGVFPPLHNNQVISETLVVSVLTFMVLWAGSLLTIILGLGLCNLDVMDAITGAFSCLSNVGIDMTRMGSNLGIGHAAWPTAAKWILMSGMILGRLELLTVIALFSRSFWRN